MTSVSSRNYTSTRYERFCNDCCVYGRRSLIRLRATWGRSGFTTTRQPVIRDSATTAASMGGERSWGWVWPLLTAKRSLFESPATDAPIFAHSHISSLAGPRKLAVELCWQALHAQHIALHPTAFRNEANFFMRAQPRCKFPDNWHKSVQSSAKDGACLTKQQDTSTAQRNKAENKVHT